MFKKERELDESESTHLFLVWLSYDGRPLQVPWGFAFGLHILGFALEGKRLLQLFGNAEWVKVSNLPLNWLWRFKDRRITAN